MGKRILSALTDMWHKPGWVYQLPVTLTALAALAVSVVSGFRLFGAQSASAVDQWLFGASMVALCVVVLYWLRTRLAQLGFACLRLVVARLQFRIVNLPQNARWPLFCGAAVGTIFGGYKLLVSQATQWHLIILALSLSVLLAAVAVEVVRHKWASFITTGIGIALIVAGGFLLGSNSQQITFHNSAMQEKDNPQIEDKHQSLLAQQKMLEQSLASFQNVQRRNQLYHLIVPQPPVYLAGRTSFHKSNVLVQLPNKGRQAYEELCQSLTYNPGNFYYGVSAEERAEFELDARRAARNLVRLIRTGQAGAAGIPNGKQGQGQQQQPGDKRDPGRDPAPGSGRMPRNTL